MKSEKVQFALSALMGMMIVDEFFLFDPFILDIYQLNVPFNDLSSFEIGKIYGQTLQLFQRKLNLLQN